MTDTTWARNGTAWLRDTMSYALDACDRAGVVPISLDCAGYGASGRLSVQCDTGENVRRVVEALCGELDAEVRLGENTYTLAVRDVDWPGVRYGMDLDAFCTLDAAGLEVAG